MIAPPSWPTSIMELPSGGGLLYARRGPRDAPTVLWVHGGFMSHKTWAPLMPLIESCYDNILVDLTGHAGSSVSAQYSMTQWAWELASLCEHLGVTRVSVVGHSLGGMVAQQLAYSHPHLVRNLVLMETTYSTQSVFGERVHRKVSQVLLHHLGVMKVAKISRKKFGEFTPEAGEHAYEEIRHFARDKTRFLAIMKAVFDFDASPWIYTLEHPTMVCVASMNKATMRQGTKMAARLRHGKLQVFDDASHMLHWDHPEMLHLKVRKFLKP